MTASDNRRRAAEEAGTRSEAEKRLLEGDAHAARQQLQAMRDNGKATLDWFRNLEAQVCAFPRDALSGNPSNTGPGSSHR